MPKKPMDYSKTIMYKLVCNDLSVTDLYVGHTTNWRQRKSNHKQSVENINYTDYNCKRATYIRENGGWDNWTMIEIEKYPCNDEREARARERHWYEELNSKLNSKCPIRSPKEFCEVYKEQKKKYHKEWREDNKEQLQKYSKEWREVNKKKIQEHKATKFVCECGSIIQNNTKYKHVNSLKHCHFIETNNI